MRSIRLRPMDRRQWLFTVLAIVGGAVIGTTAFGIANRWLVLAGIVPVPGWLPSFLNNYEGDLVAGIHEATGGMRGNWLVVAVTVLLLVVNVLERRGQTRVGDSRRAVGALPRVQVVGPDSALSGDPGAELRDFALPEHDARDRHPRRDERTDPGPPRSHGDRCALMGVAAEGSLRRGRVRARSLSLRADAHTLLTIVCYDRVVRLHL